MTHPLGDDQAQAQARFFGRITASVTHEIKNHLALINEYNGLAADLLAAQARGRELDVGRLAGLCQEVRRQVREGSEVVGQLNRLGHSVDSEQEEVDLGELMRTFVALSRRRAQRRRIELDLDLPIPAPALLTQPFLLLLACHLLLEAILEACPQGGVLRLALGQGPTGPALVFDCQAPDPTRVQLPSWLLSRLGAGLAAGPGRALMLTLAPAEPTVAARG